MKSATISLVLLLALSVPLASQSRTWRVNTMGTGDAPNLYAAMDSASAYDSVLVAAGTYVLPGGLGVPNGVRLVSESGPGYTLLSLQGAPTYVAVELRTSALISGFYVKGNPYSTYTLYLHNGADADHCIVETPGGPGCLGGEGPGLSRLYSCLFIGAEIRLPGYFYLCIIMSNMTSLAIGSTLDECDVLGEVDPAIDASDYNLNFSLDPEFCGISGSGNYFLKSTSPCVPGNGPYPFPALIGPLGVGCGTVKVQASTWGAVKALYRSP